MLTTISIILLIALIFDGIKILIETIGVSNIQEGSSDPSRTAAIVSVYNNADIIDTIDSIIHQFSEIIVIDDGSDDDTTAVLTELGEYVESKDLNGDTFCVKRYKDKDIKIIFNSENKGKVPSVHSGLEFVTKEFCFICDDDILLSDNFDLPTSLLIDDEADAISFFVIPEPNDKWLLYNIQLHEYVKSMQIGRRFADKSKSVECISGCAGLFKTERLREFSKEHSSKWQGEDLERTLIELIHDGRVIYSEQLIYTDVPKTFRQLSAQRIKAWWGGLYRNVPNFFKLIKGKNKTARIRFESLYNIISLIVDPIKLITLFLLVVNLNYSVLFLIYIIYVFFELYIYLRYASITPVKPKLYAILVYPFYGLLQLNYRILAGIYMIVKRINMKFAATTIILLALLTSIAVGQDKKDTIVSYTGTHYALTGNYYGDYNANLYLGYKKAYVNVNYGLYDQVNLGWYQNKFLFDVGIRKNTLTPSIMYTEWLGNHILRVQARYNYNYGDIDKTIYPNTTIIGAGYGYYRSNGLYYFDIIQELDRNYATTAIMKGKEKILEDIYIVGSTSINNEKHYTYHIGIEVKGLSLSHIYHSNFDFTGYTLKELSIGYKIRF